MDSVLLDEALTLAYEHTRNVAEAVLVNSRPVHDVATSRPYPEADLIAGVAADAVRQAVVSVVDGADRTVECATP